MEGHKSTVYLANSEVGFEHYMSCSFVRECCQKSEFKGIRINVRCSNNKSDFNKYQ